MALELHKTLKPAPNWRNIQNAALNRWVNRVPLYEHGVGEKVILETTGYTPYALWYLAMIETVREWRGGCR